MKQVHNTENHSSNRVSIPLLHYFTSIGSSAGLPRSGKNIWKMIFFQVREKSGNFVDGQGNLEGNSKINSYGR